jgi:hypothetical protein
VAARPSAPVEDPRAAVAAPVAAAVPRRATERVVDGVGLHRGPDGAWRRTGPVEELLRITGPDEPVAAVADWLTRGAPSDAPDGVLEVARALGLLTPATPQACGPVAIVGSGPVADETRRVLAAEGLDVRAGSDAERLGPAGVVVVVDPVQRDAAWQELDVRLRAAGVPWHRAFRDGRRWVVGPFWTGPGDAGYVDHRIRRLAADPHPDELEARWRADPPVLPLAPPTGSGTHAVAAIMAGWLAADVVALDAGARPAGVDTEVLLDPVTGVVERHPVLAVPPGPTL